MALETEIRAALATLSPQALEVINESALHSGHAGDDGSGESHWRIVIKAESLNDMSRIARHRAIHAALGKTASKVTASTLSPVAYSRQQRQPGCAGGPSGNRCRQTLSG